MANIALIINTLLQRTELAAIQWRLDADGSYLTEMDGAKYAIERDTYLYDESHECFGYRLFVYHKKWIELANEKENPAFADELSELGGALEKLYKAAMGACAGRIESAHYYFAVTPDYDAQELSVESIRRKEKDYLAAINRTHENSAEAISAFHDWYTSAKILFDRYCDSSDRELKAFCDVDTSGNGHSLLHIYHMVISSCSVLLDRITRRQKQEAMKNENTIPSNNEVFIVHGHDSAMKESVKNLLLKLGLKPIILAEEPNEGRTIIEKFEAHTQKTEYAVVLLSDDEDMGHAHNEKKNRPRARQNVILELGYFIGKLTRKRVCVLKKKNVETPSDILGVGYTEYVQDSKDWQIRLADELISAGYKVDKNLI